MRSLSLIGFSLLAAIVMVLGAWAAAGEAPAPKAPAAAEGGWIQLFNGKDIEGWKAVGNGKWWVEDGCIVGVPVETKGGDLFTEKEFDNFECRFTYKAVWPANSGIWYRTKYQFDILDYKNPVAFSGSLYSGKPFLFTNLDKSIEDREGWNEGQIYANGKHLIHWLNGRKIGECDDATSAKGKFGVQVHPGQEFVNMKIFVKKIEVRLLKADDKPTEPVAPKKDAK